jgi:hypothetical protein
MDTTENLDAEQGRQHNIQTGNFHDAVLREL